MAKDTLSGPFDSAPMTGYGKYSLVALRSGMQGLMYAREETWTRIKNGLFFLQIKALFP